MPYSLKHSTRIKRLQRDLIAAVPRFPNDRTSLQAIQAKDLPDLLITFISWRLRHVGVRPRQVVGRQNLAADPRATALAPNIDAFLRVVEEGGDLTPYLSVEPRTRGYTPAAEGKGHAEDRWADKDFLLNVMGLHHFHLGLVAEAAGHMARTNEVMFASVTRDTFDVLGLFDHAVFDHAADDSMTTERENLWSSYEARQVKQMLPGQLSIGGYGGLGLSTSGHPTAVVLTVQNHVRLLRDIDPKLEDTGYVRSIYPGWASAKPKLRWFYRHLDLCLVDDATSVCVTFRKGPN